MSLIFDDNMREQISKRSKRALDVDKMSPEAQANYYKKVQEQIAADEKWLAENDHTGVDWDSPSEGFYTVGKTEFAEDEYDPSLSPEEEEELIRDSEEESVDSGYLTEDEFEDFFDLDDDTYFRLVERTHEGNRISQELFGTTGTENMTHEQINEVRVKLGLTKKTWDE